MTDSQLRLELFWDVEQATIRRKRVKNITIYVKSPEALVEVTAPNWVSDAEIRSFLEQKRSWIERKRAEILASPQSLASQASAEEQEQWKAVVAATVPVLVEKWEQVLNVKAGKLAYRNMRSRWGSCQPATGRICINTRLALYPPRCLEYVVVHELCHLIEKGHGPRFKALLDAYLPNWRESRDMLR